MLLPIALILAACGHVGNKVVSDDTLKEKAAFALSVDPSAVSISNRRADIDSIKFTATVRGHKHQCYITTVMGAISSDALCNNMSEKQKAKTCNKLLQAAGRC